MPQYCQSMISVNHSVSQLETNAYSQHCHPLCEVYCPVEGDVDYHVEGVNYHPAPGSLLLLAPGTFHGFRARSDAPYHRYTLHFDPQLLASDVRGALLSPFFQQGIYVRDAQAYLPYLTGICTCETLPPSVGDVCAQAQVTALLGRLLADLGTVTQAAASANATLTQQVITYLGLHLAEHNTLDSLAKRFFVSRSHLSRAFYQETGASVAEYIRRKRLIYADMMRRQGMSATDAALKAGFGDYSTYYRTLRREEERQ